MFGKYYKHNSQLPEEPPHSHQPSPQRIRTKRSQELQRKLLQRKIYGDHYNYNRHGLNKEKKYLLEQQRNTQIERANRILLEKIRKIGQRSVQLPSKPREPTEKSPADYFSRERSTNMNTLYKRKETPFRSTLHQLAQSKVSLVSARKPQYEGRQVLFRGSKQIDGVVLEMVSYFEGGMYVIAMARQNMHHKIRMTLEDYEVLLHESLQDNHSNILNLLSFNGGLLELRGTKQPCENIIEEELTLPVLHKQILHQMNRNIAPVTNNPAIVRHRIQTE